MTDIQCTRREEDPSRRQYLRHHSKLGSQLPPARRDWCHNYRSSLEPWVVWKKTYWTRCSDQVFKEDTETSIVHPSQTKYYPPKQRQLKLQGKRVPSFSSENKRRLFWVRIHNLRGLVKGRVGTWQGSYIFSQIRTELFIFSFRFVKFDHFLLRG